jgi:hypothetical protein
MEIYIMSDPYYFTRSNEGVIHDHFHSIESALEYFLAEDGYRLDIQISKDQIVHFYRDTFKNEKLSFQVANSKILYYNNNQTTDNSNVFVVDFANNN